MNEITSITDLQWLVRTGETDWKQYGEVNAAYYEGMVLFNYSQTAQFAGRWNYFERIARGLILDAYSGEVIARPFDKFFNWGERENYTPVLNITEKLDGSLGILYRHQGQYRIATRGSFTSSQALWATWFLNTHHKLDGLDDDLTLLFEIIYPANRVVVDYKGLEELTLIGARSRSAGYELTFSELERLALRFGFPLVRRYLFDSVANIIDACHALSANAEGWVVRFADGERLKFKGDAYRLAHRIMTGVTFNRVLDAVRDGLFEQMIEGVPDEFLGQIKAWKAEIDTAVEQTKAGVQSALERAPQGTQKDFALWVQAEYPKDIQSYLFAAKAGKDITPLIYRKAFENRPHSNEPQAESEG